MARSIAELLRERGLSLEELEAASGLDGKVVQAIVRGQYTASPAQRQRLAAALGVVVDEIAWGHTEEVQNLYGHGPQFGRTP